jgi:hypothetical protein
MVVSVVICVVTSVVMSVVMSEFVSVERLGGAAKITAQLHVGGKSSQSPTLIGSCVDH